MRPTTLILFPSALLAFLLQSQFAAVQAQIGDSDFPPVTVTILPEAIVDDTIVTLDQVAKLTGGTAALRKRLGKLDVIDFPSNASHRVVTADQVRFRLLLADMEASAFRMSGVKRTTIIEADAPVTLRKLVAAAEHAVLTQYPGDAATVTVTAAKGIVVPSVETRVGDRLRLEAAVKGSVPLTGRVRAEVSLNVNGKRREVVPVFLQITRAAAGVEFVGNHPSPIRPVAYVTPGAGSPAILVKARDNVKIVAVIGSARVEASGEAMQDGAIGQVIRVRNVESNRIVHGRVDAGGVITVEY